MKKEKDKEGEVDDLPPPFFSLFIENRKRKKKGVFPFFASVKRGGVGGEKGRRRFFSRFEKRKLLYFTSAGPSKKGRGKEKKGGWEVYSPARKGGKEAPCVHLLFPRWPRKKIKREKKKEKRSQHTTYLLRKKKGKRRNRGENTPEFFLAAHIRKKYGYQNAGKKKKATIVL